MVDPLGIPALTIAVLDQLWRIGRATSDLIADFREFDSDTQKLESKINDENNRTRTLRCLLFQPLPIYENNTLFERFDDGVQNQIQIMFEQLLGVVDEAFQLLSRRQAAAATTPSPNAPPSQTRSTSSLSLSRHKSLQRWRWTLMDRKRIEAIIENFGELNGRIHENVKLWCLGTSIGVDLQHLRRLESDVYAREIGFDMDARLQLSATAASSAEADLELRDADLVQEIQRTHPVEDKFAVLEWNGEALLVEYRSYAPEATMFTPLDSRTRALVEKLARLLHQPKETIFRTPSCRGWVHESFRSDNILFFPDQEQSGDSCKDGIPSRLDWSQPWLLGFEFSRPETFFSNGEEDSCIEREIYRHPDRQGKPAVPFNKLHDIYALGVVLLEIGLWQPAITICKDQLRRTRDPLTIHQLLVRRAEKYLGQKTGPKYRKAVLDCLRGDFGVTEDSKEDLKLQQVFRLQVVEVLERAAGSI
ncbi:protein kinase-like [Diplodia corticola]|uniref:Protein kinase-like n=1 Tax=Diplodia corticola TaxID=236234 RepID=A0A1J9SJ45_9PEZI|nr:protein kinase-like [Diplodia corticola]OJD40375.1 protein kinase-like [Diplodia corticola]